MNIDKIKNCGLDYQSFFLLKKGLKPVIRTGIRKDKINLLKKLAKTNRLFISVKKFNELYGKKLEKSGFIAYISLSKKTIEEAYMSEKNGDRLKFGELLGYPRCCIKSFIKEMVKKNDFVVSAYKNSLKKPSFFCNNIFVFDSKIGIGNTIDIYKNNPSLYFLEDLFLIRHVPCSFNCKKSIKIGKKTSEILKEKKPGLESKIINAIKRPFLYFDYFNWILFEGEVEENEINYKKILPYKSLLPKEKIDIIKKGNKIKVFEDKIIVIKKDRVIGEINKNNKHRGIILDFS